MIDRLTEIFPILLEGLGDTLYMAFASTVFAYLIGLPLGVRVVVTEKGGLLPNRPLHTVLSWITDIGRSIPFIILIVALMPLTRLVAGTTIGATAAIVPLVIAAAPFVARLVETALKELDSGVVEAARSMGATNAQVIFKVMLPESVPSLVRGISITAITLISYSAMAGTVGAGGLGDIAIRYGYHRYQTDVMWITILILVILVAVIQLTCSRIARRIDKRNR